MEIMNVTFRLDRLRTSFRPSRPASVCGHHGSHFSLGPGVTRMSCAPVLDMSGRQEINFIVKSLRFGSYYCSVTYYPDRCSLHQILLCISQHVSTGEGGSVK